MNIGKINRANQAKRAVKIKTAVVLLIAGVLLIGGTVWLVKYVGKQEGDLPGQLYPEISKEHIAIGAEHPPYNSNPPTSGHHYGQAAEWGVYKEQMPDEQLIHNLEHGGVWISYKPGISDEIVKNLEGMFDKYGRKKIIVTPRPENDTDIALAVWTRLEKFNVSEYSDERVENFIRRLKNKTGPEPFAP
ncbi:MAG: hypothetical protein A3G49_04135 [Candidatus Sungbacteria bacterium RIFCSPLOWO2_12_FULL_41_11]|uniref:DUF3105 domain-containing protein n=1 Tax=Candidatus Sungbacteria bacterium RIFCSPLOWO2_12_FULL_41_11 TaxID=1802286 RepID=A0A1G2LT90_9BACT|nr:MAG: hypothetical protein A3D41_02600 [Candidatus Sungbacteria bacterium RIFCSPHIGHO2_02_FULL_41_12b]OHA14850.1 MAG: hypothetical protein A3G49_04135 [Candidatus Sungbacteria bacterium RIFCSPLOWO2_12_FULL_41_11]